MMILSTIGEDTMADERARRLEEIEHELEEYFTREPVPPPGDLPLTNTAYREWHERRGALEAERDALREQLRSDASQ
jgi:hypothetical protein